MITPSASAVSIGFFIVTFVEHTRGHYVNTQENLLKKISDCKASIP